MPRDIPKAYEPQPIEARWAQEWFESRLFRADAEAGGPVFSIVIPPPNVTGSLHIGHMLEHTEIDILTRWHRMRGFNALYLPGTDHAGISTQRVVVKLLASEGVDYRSIGREAFEQRVWQWKQESGETIKRQMIQIGESCDWTRERFTLDPALSRAVREVFVRLYEEGLIYRAHYMVNWCPHCGTAISDLETAHSERQGKLWYIRYPLLQANERVVVATTRPETMLGDAAVAVHPEDARYVHLLGKKVLLPLLNREIPIVADPMVDREFGTGAVKVTPAHDPNDFEVGRRHNLPEIDVLTADGHMSAAAGPYAGLDRLAARERVVADLEALGLIEKIVAHTHSVGACDRCGTDIEPRASTQWFLRMKPLAEPAIEAVESGRIEMVPANRRSEYFEWMRNIRDWCISRQLWWGHRIPAWHCASCKEITVARETPPRCAHCGSERLEQDPDVLDTWFSSALWPFSTLGWPEKTSDYRVYYPTSVMITAYDILFFWVARMIMMGLKFTGEVPFRRVYLHSLVRTAQGEKMSKSKGTGLDPMALTSQYGTDALRFTLASMAAPGTDVFLSEDKLLSGRAFANKIWNAARFLFVNLEKAEAGGLAFQDLASPEIREGAPQRQPGPEALADRWIFSRLADTTETLNAALQEFRFHEAAQMIYHFFWDDFCDWYIEWQKPLLASSDAGAAKAAWRNLFAVFEAALRLLHPFMPFLTEELWRRLPQHQGAVSIGLEKFVSVKPGWKDAAAERDVTVLQEIIAAARNLRAEFKIEPRKKIPAEIAVADPRIRDLAEAHKLTAARLASLSELHVVPGPLSGSDGAVRSTALFDLRIVYQQTADTGAELERLRKETKRLAKDLESKRRRLADDEFRSRAPSEIVRALESTLAEREAEYQKLAGRVAQLESPGANSGGSRAGAPD